LLETQKVASSEILLMQFSICRKEREGSVGKIGRFNFLGPRALLSAKQKIDRNRGLTISNVEISYFGDRETIVEHGGALVSISSMVTRFRG